MFHKEKMVHPSKESFTNSQNNFFDKVNQGVDIFLTGKAGTGKSFVLKEYLSQVDTVLCFAPTGMAAVNVGGQTLHSFFSIEPNGVWDVKKVRYLSKEKKAILEAATSIVIDEVSMVRPDILDAVDQTIKHNGFSGLFGFRVIFCGDMAQLKPVITQDQFPVMDSIYEGYSFKDAICMREVDLQICDLQEVLRQKSPEFIDNLNILRDDSTRVMPEYWREFYRKDIGKDFIVLAKTNSVVNSYNEKGLNSMDGPFYTSEGQTEGDFKQSHFQFVKSLKFKSGARVMWLVNRGDLVNGTMGSVFYSKDKKLFFESDDGDVIECQKEMQESFKYTLDEGGKLKLKRVGAITQYPFKVAYALTVHKSQGQTFKSVLFDTQSIGSRLTDSSRSLVYTALSRCSNPEKLCIL